MIVPLLERQGEHLDLLVLSHRDSDHTGGAAAVLARQPGLPVLSSLASAHPLLQGRGNPPGRNQRCQAGQSWQWDGVRFDMLHPTRASYDDETVNDNNRGCVLRCVRRCWWRRITAAKRHRSRNSYAPSIHAS